MFLSDNYSETLGTIINTPDMSNSQYTADSDDFQLCSRIPIKCNS